MPLLFVVVSTLLLLSTIKINRADLNGVIDRESFLVKYFVRNAVQNLLFASGAEERSEAVLILQLDKIFVQGPSAELAHTIAQYWSDNGRC